MYGILSNSEKIYTRRGCECGIRRDGRGMNDFRHLRMENSIFPHVNGSSYVSLSDSMNVLCSIKMETIECLKEFPDKGVLLVSADISPSCGLKIDEKARSELSGRLGERLQSILLGSNAIDLGSLCIIPGKYCWLMHVDLVVNQLDGDPFDVCSIATYLALQSTRVPRVDVVIGESGKPDDFQICGDIEEAHPLPINSIPLCITIAKVGEVLIVDATSAEHASAAFAFTVSLDRNNNLCGMFKLHGHGAATISELSSIMEVRSNT
eukprot:GSChrysophyteH1.ASY1.ANO1.26.1 assembled CDS